MTNTTDVESVNIKKGNKKWIIYIALLVIFQTIIISVLFDVVFKAKSPSVKLRSITVENMAIVNASSSSSFNISLSGEIAIKNKNFGHYKFYDSSASFSYRGVEVGKVLIPEGRVKARKTRRIDFSVLELNSKLVSGNSNLRSDINSGFLTFTSEAKLRGNVHFFKVLDKYKTTEMDCSITVDLKTKAIQNLSC